MKISPIKLSNKRMPVNQLLWLLICLILLGFSPMISQLSAQGTRMVTGTVLSAADNIGIPGVNVIEKGTTNGTVTNIDGEYSITVSESSRYLVFSFVGMKTLEMQIGTNSIINVTMEEDIIGLDEVIAIGYGTVRKSDLTGAVGSVKSEEIRKVPVTSLDQSLQGRVAGVQIIQVSAQPGGNALLRIRGGNSIYAGNEPLYVIDGMPVDSKENLSWISSPVINGLSALNPNDIESMEILKDASATSIYGARGANGVVLITTKRGKSGMDRVSFEGYYGIQDITKRIDVMNGAQYARLYDEAGLNAAIDDGTTYTPVYPNPDSIGEGTDWQKEIYRTAPMQNYQLSVSGGSPSTQYSISGNFFSQEGVIIGSDFKRYSFRTNLDHSIREKLKVGTSFAVSHTNANTVGSSTPAGFFPGVVNTSLTMSPALPIRDSTGQYTLTDPHADAWLDNPVAVTRDVKALDKAIRFVGNIYANYTIIKGLDLRVTFGLDQSHDIQDYYNPTYTYSGSFNSGQARFATTDFRTLLNENTLTYSNTFKDRHRINVMGGFTYNYADSRTFIDIVTGYPNDRLGYYGIQSAANKPTIYTGFGEEALVSYLGRINYSLDDKYLVTLTHRIDGSSKFGPNNRFAHFPSVAIAWRLSSEEFMKDLTFLYNLKLRASIGVSGNESIFNYLYIPTIGSSVYYFNNGYPATGYAPDRIGNDDLKWESTRQADIGIDAAFIEGRISFTTDYYHKLTYDMLYSAEVPYTSGFANAMLNVGTMVNNGFEFTLNTANLVKAFKWNTDFSFSLNRSRITDLNNNDDTYISDDEYKLKIGYWSVISEGEELGSFFGLESDGIWQLDEAEEAALYNAKPGDFKYVDQNDDDMINADDRLIIGHAQPDFIWSLNNTFSYKNFELTAYIQAVHGNDILNSNRFELESGNGLSNASIEMLNRWTSDNPSDIYPRANRNVDYLHMSDRYLEDGSYVRLQLLSLSYDLPATVLQKAGIYTLRFFITGKNLLTFTDYSGFDPEVGAFGTSNIRQGYDLGGYPTARIYTAGFRLEF